MPVIVTLPAWMVLTTKSIDVCPIGMTTLAGTVATEVFELESVIVAPPAGAAAPRTAVPVAVAPPATEAGLMLIDASAALDGRTVSDPVALATPDEAVIVTLRANDGLEVVTTKEPVVPPLPIVTVAGTEALGSELVREITVPPVCAGARRRMPPIVDEPPASVCDSRLTEPTPLTFVIWPLTAIARDESGDTLESVALMVKVSPIGPSTGMENEPLLVAVPV